MTADQDSVESPVRALQERAKELDCIYRVDDLLKPTDRPLPEVCRDIIELLPLGWQDPRLCHARIILGDVVVQKPEFEITPWVQSADIIVEEEVRGKVEVFFREQAADADKNLLRKDKQKLMNAIAGRIAAGTVQRMPRSAKADAAVADRYADQHWRWRFDMAQRIAARLNPAQFGVEAFYLIGSTKNATAGPASDIDILLHFKGTEPQRQQLLHYLEGWSQCLDEINFLRTGWRTDGLLDVHLVTDEDIAVRSSYAAKIDAISDPARKLPMNQAPASLEELA